jgi:hypothetical protein
VLAGMHSMRHFSTLQGGGSAPSYRHRLSIGMLIWDHYLRIPFATVCPKNLTHYRVQADYLDVILDRLQYQFNIVSKSMQMYDGAVANDNAMSQRFTLYNNKPLTTRHLHT